MGYPKTLTTYNEDKDLIFLIIVTSATEYTRFESPSDSSKKAEPEVFKNVKENPFDTKFGLSLIALPSQVDQTQEFEEDVPQSKIDSLIAKISNQ